MKPSSNAPQVLSYNMGGWQPVTSGALARTPFKQGSLVALCREAEIGINEAYHLDRYFSKRQLMAFCRGFRPSLVMFVSDHRTAK